MNKLEIIDQHRKSPIISKPPRDARSTLPSLRIKTAMEGRAAW